MAEIIKNYDPHSLIKNKILFNIKTFNHLFSKNLQNKILLNERIFIAGAGGMAGSAIYRSFLKHGYGQKFSDGVIFTPQEKNLI